jgi:hypothetical protein
MQHQKWVQVHECPLYVCDLGGCHRQGMGFPSAFTAVTLVFRTPLTSYMPSNTTCCCIPLHRSPYTSPARQPTPSSTQLDLTALPAPPLASQQQQAQAQAQQQAAEAASLPLLRFQPLVGVAAAPRVPWPLTLLGIGVANILGLRLVLAALRSWQDSEWRAASKGCAAAAAAAAAGWAHTV